MIKQLGPKQIYIKSHDESQLKCTFSGKNHSTLNEMQSDQSHTSALFLISSKQSCTLSVDLSNFIAHIENQIDPATIVPSQGHCSLELLKSLPSEMQWLSHELLPKQVLKDHCSCRSEAAAVPNRRDPSLEGILASLYTYFLLQSHGKTDNVWWETSQVHQNRLGMSHEVHTLPWTRYHPDKQCSHHAMTANPCKEDNAVLPKLQPWKVVSVATLLAKTWCVQEYSSQWKLLHHHQQSNLTISVPIFEIWIAPTKIIKVTTIYLVMSQWIFIKVSNLHPEVWVTSLWLSTSIVSSHLVFRALTGLIHIFNWWATVSAQPLVKSKTGCKHKKCCKHHPKQSLSKNEELDTSPWIES